MTTDFFLSVKGSNGWLQKLLQELYSDGVRMAADVSSKRNNHTCSGERLDHK